MRWSPFVLVVSLSLSSACLSPTNAFDPDAPPEAQARGELSGKIQAVTSLAPGEIVTGVPGEGETLVENAFCAPRAGDHAGFDVVLRELAASGGAPLTARTETTSSTGEFRFQNIPPGRYSLEVLRPGFEVPPPRTLDFTPGERIDLPPLCALSRVAPEAPLLDALPPLVDERNRAPGSAGDGPALIRILSCEENATYTVRQLAEGGVAEGGTDPSTTVVLDGGEGQCETPLSLVDPAGVPARSVWRIEVVAEDALGNRSETTTSFVVRDTLAPAAPSDVTLTPGRDRVNASWTQPDPGDDDAPAGWLVSYALTARAGDQGAPCAYGAPAALDGDAHDTAAFALEGPSPLVVGTASANLSGLLPGTAVTVQVAAYDEAGNLSCWSAPAVARPDEVAAALEHEDDGGVFASGGTYFFRGHALFARGSAGLAYVAPDGTRTDLSAGTALDVSGIGRLAYAAAGVAGIHRVTLSPGGGLPAYETHALDGDDVRSVLARPGLVVVGTSSGLRFFDPEAGSATPVVDPDAQGSPVVDVAGEGPLLFLSRGIDGGSGRVQVLHRSDASVVQGEVLGLGAAPVDLLVAHGALWFIDGERVRAFDFGACFAAPGGDCLVESFATPMLAGATPRALAVWDDLVLAAVEGGDLPSASAVVALEPTEGGAPRVVGVAFGDDDDVYRHLEAREGGFCAAGAFGRACYRSVVQPLAEAPVRVTIGADVVHATTDEDSAFLFSGGDLVVEVGFDGVERARWTLPQIEPLTGSGFPAGNARVMPSQALDGVGVVTLDLYGRAYLGAPGTSGAFTRIDADLPAALRALWPEATLDDTSDVVTLTHALVDTDGDRVVVLAQNELRGSGGCAPTALLVIPLVEAPDGALATGDPQRIALADSGRLAQLLVESGVAYVSTLPFGVTAVDLDEGAVIDGGGVAAELGCEVAQLGEGKAYGVHPLSDAGTRTLVVAGQAQVGSGYRDRFFALGSDADLPLTSVGAVQAVGAAGRFLAVGTALGGVYLYDALSPVDGATSLAPVLNLPTVSQILAIQPTRRGLLLADGPGGAVLHRLR